MPENERIATNLRTLMILEIVGHSDQALSPTEINQELGLPKQTVHRLCATLVSEGFLAYEPGRKKLRPARRSRLMASGILYTSRIHIARRQILQDVADRTGETVNFVVPEEGGMSYLDRVETDWPFRVQLPIGTNVPFHCTASGKTFLAGLRPAQRKSFIGSLVLERMTSKTITEPARLMEETTRIARDGYALDDEEFMEGMVAIAVPVVDQHRRFMAALAFHGPTIRLSTQTLLDRKHILLDASAKLTEALVG